MYGKKKMMKKGGDKTKAGSYSKKFVPGMKKFPDLTGDGKVTRADILKGRGVFKNGGNKATDKELSEQKKEEVRKIKRRLDSYTPQTQRKPQGRPQPFVDSNTYGAEADSAPKRMGGKLEGSAKNFAAIAERARKAKKPR